MVVDPWNAVLYIGINTPRIDAVPEKSKNATYSKSTVVGELSDCPVWPEAGGDARWTDLFDNPFGFLQNWRP